MQQLCAYCVGQTVSSNTTYALRQTINTLRPTQDGRCFPDDPFKHIFLNENTWHAIKIPLDIVSKDPINYIPSLVQIMV